jgi:hypothetical protein
MISSKADSDARLERDMERWRKDLADWRMRGLGHTSPAQTIRGG